MSAPFLRVRNLATASQKYQVIRNVQSRVFMVSSPDKVGTRVSSDEIKSRCRGIELCVFPKIRLLKWFAGELRRPDTELFRQTL